MKRLKNYWNVLITSLRMKKELRVHYCPEKNRF